MGASEKLKALESTEVRGVWDGKRLLPALPQIVAVIDVAERIATTDDDVWGTSRGLGFKLQDRLADLEEALS